MRRTETSVDVAQQNHARFDGKPIPTTNRSSSSAALRSNWSEWASSPRAPTTPRTVDRAVRSAGSSPAARFPTRGPRTASAPLRGARQPARRRHIAAAERGSARGRPPQARATSREPPKVRRLRGMRRTRLDSDNRSRNLTVPLVWRHTGHIALTRPSRWDPVSVPNLLSCNTNGHVSVFAPWDA